MTTKNIQNEIVKRDYFKFLEHADGKSGASIRQIDKSIRRFEEFTKFADFKAFNQKQAMAYKATLQNRELAKASILSEVNKLKRFLKWLSGRPGYKDPQKGIRCVALVSPHPDRSRGFRSY